MTTAQLVACAGCARHVRASEGSCPFCGAAVTVRTARASITRTGPTTRLGRAGLAALGVGAIALPLGLADCAESAQMAVYGGPPPDLIESDAGHADAPPPAKPPPPAPAK